MVLYIAPGEMDEEEFKRFHTELGKLLFYIKYSDNKEYLKQKVEQNPEYRSVDEETVDFVNLVTNSKLTYKKRKDGKVDMCQAIEGIRNEGIEMGMEKGYILALFNLVEKGAITMESAAAESGLSLSDFEAKAKEYTNKITNKSPEPGTCRARPLSTSLYTADAFTSNLMIIV